MAKKKLPAILEVVSVETERDKVFAHWATVKPEYESLMRFVRFWEDKGFNLENERGHSPNPRKLVLEYLEVDEEALEEARRSLLDEIAARNSSPPLAQEGAGS